MRCRLDAWQISAGLLQVNTGRLLSRKGTQSVPFLFGLIVANINTFRFVLALAFLAGLLAPNHYFPWPAFYNEAPVGVAFLPLAVYCLFFNKSPQLPRYIWLLVALPAVPILQWLFGLIHFGGDAWVTSLYLLGAVIAYIVGHVLAASPACGARRLLRWLAWLLVIGTLISAVIALRQAFGLSGALWEMELPTGTRPYANLGQPNQLATLLVLGVLSALYLFANKDFGGAAFLVIALALGGAFAAAQSRAALLSVGMLGMWVYWRMPVAEPETRSVRRAALLALAGFVVLWFFWPAFYDLCSVGGGTVSRGAGDRSRLLIWRQMMEAALREPVIGWGWGQASFAQLEVVDKFPNAVNIESSHNLFLDLLIWNGIPLGLLMVFMVLAWCWRHASRTQTVDSWFALALVGAVMVHAMLEFPLNYAYFLLPLSICAGVVDAAAAAGGRRQIFPKAVFASLIAGAAVLFFGIVTEYPVAETRIRQLRFESMGIAKRDSASEEDLAPLRFLTQIQSFIEFARSRAVEGMSDEELERMRIVSHRFPFPPSLFRYSLALALNGRLDAASLEMQRLRHLHGEKHYSEAKLNLRALYVRYPQLSALELP